MDRLRQIRSLISVGGRYNTSQTKLLCLSAAGFTDRLLRHADTADDVLLVDAGDLYGEL
jgi:hypothetical protein